MSVVDAAAIESGAPQDNCTNNNSDDNKDNDSLMTTFDVRRGMADLRKMFYTQNASMYTERMPRLQHLSAANFCVKVVLATLAKRRARSALKKHHQAPADAGAQK